MKKRQQLILSNGACPFTNARELSQMMIERQNVKTHQFDKVLEVCQMHIASAVKVNRMHCLVEVPEFILGYPLYDINDCILYVVSKLKQYEYKVSYYFPKLLHISWIPEKQQCSANAEQLVDLLKQMHTSDYDLSNKPLYLTHDTLVSYQDTHASDKSNKHDSLEHQNNNGISKKDAKKKPRPISEFKPSGKFTLDLT